MIHLELFFENYIPYEHFLKVGRESLRLISKGKLFQSLQDLSKLVFPLSVSRTYLG